MEIKKMPDKLVLLKNCEIDSNNKIKTIKLNKMAIFDQMKPLTQSQKK